MHSSAQAEVMRADVDGGRLPTRNVVLVFVALAILLGPVMSNASATFDAAVNWQVQAGAALAALIAGCVLFAVSVVRGEHALSGWQWLALFVLLVPRSLSLLLGSVSLRPWLHETRAGVALLLALGAPLWVGLLSSLRIVPIEVPRAVVVVGIAGVGGVLLLIPTDAYVPAMNQIPMLTVRLLLSIAVVFTWWFAREQLDGARVLPTAAAFLLLSAGMNAVSSVAIERSAWQPVDWRDAAVPIMLQAVLAAVSFYLWFYLLTRMPLAGFSLHPLAAWAASLLPGLVLVHFMAWRADVALAIVVCAIAVGLQSRIADEQPTSLGLRVE